MPIRAVVFVSEARTDLTEAHLATIIADAARFNRNVGVSGVTLFDWSRFLAYMEGPPDALDVAFSRARGASSHSHLIEVARGRVGQRRVSYWPMQLVNVEVPCPECCEPTGPVSCNGRMRVWCRRPRWSCLMRLFSRTPLLHDASAA